LGAFETKLNITIDGGFKYRPHQKEELLELLKLYNGAKNHKTEIMFSIFGSGKTDVYIPFLCYYAIAKHDYNNIIVCVPDHLVDQTEKGIFQKII
jgi:primosomal protein N'